MRRRLRARAGRSATALVAHEQRRREARHRERREERERTAVVPVRVVEVAGDERPDRARPELWRRFAQGERGKTIASLGGVRDRSSLALTSARMRQDTIFRDAVHHFLRLFDKTFVEFEKNASDQEVAALAETRTARAFMLLGRVTGIFD